jgi:NAD(P)H-nitrite reductase large subunit
VRFDYLIIGNSAGGIGAAEGIREIASSGTIAMVSEEPYPAYSRPLISKLLTGERTVDSMLFRSPDFYQRNNIDFMPGIKVARLNPEKHSVTLNDKTELVYGKLLLATGGEPVRPQLSGDARKGTFFFQSIDDAHAVGEYIESGMRAVVIGGGLMGLSLSEALAKKGLKVTIVELKDRLLSTILDETGSNIVREVINSKGINILTNHTVIGLKGKSAVKYALIGNGDKLPCDLLACAIGVRPRINLAKTAGIAINHGIKVDTYMTTSQPDIYACGDAAEAYDFIKEEYRVIPIWPNAYIGGRTAGLNMAGQKTEYPFSTVMNSMNYFGMDLATAGIIESPPGSNIEVLSYHRGQVYKKLLLKDGYIVGLIFINDIEKSGMLFGLMRERINVTSFRDSLLDENFGLAYLPDELRWQRLGISKNGKAINDEAVKQPLLSKI